jgi:hypothetical protein
MPAGIGGFRPDLRPCRRDDRIDRPLKSSTFHLFDDPLILRPGTASLHHGTGSREHDSGWRELDDEMVFDDENGRALNFMTVTGRARGEDGPL